MLSGDMRSPEERSSLFDFTQHLSERERSLLASPAKWRWLGSCFPENLVPLNKHRSRKWYSDVSHCHAPPQRELFFCLSGTTAMAFEDKIYGVYPGTVFLFDHHESHALVRPPSERNFRQLWLHLPDREHMGSNLYSVDRRGIESDLRLRIRSDAFVTMIYDAWTACCSEVRDGINRVFLQTVLAGAFMEALGRPVLPPSRDAETRVVEVIENYIENHLDEPLTLSRLAKLAGYNPYSFHRIFKRHRKLTLHRHIISRRIAKARKLLLEGYKVEAVAEAVGISSAAVFSRFFKSQAELSPTLWREKNRYEIE